ncbi:MAG TPA: pyridoxamine 5'-phosphate oxidase family protein [Kofleriaceae bacterium]|nr:pyridoxamine 5'-phosphate oxidase family protein [Kofleriaceae bacterium]
MFSDAVKRIQSERGSRAAYAKVEANHGFNVDIDDDLREFLAGIDTAFLATSDASGQPYIQHRGGPKGFIRVLDDHTLAFVDYAGNRQYISTGNLIENAKVCLFLIDYAHRQRVKVWGTARMVPATPELLERITAAIAPSSPIDAQPTVPSSPIAKRARTEQVCLITVSRWDVNCPQHIPVKLDAQDVALAVDKLQARIVELEAENAALRQHLIR